MGFLGNYVRNLASIAAFRQPRRPLLFSYYVTHRCDLDCEHCYLDKKEKPELNTAELRSVLDQLHELGVMRLLWSGGEVYARPDFPDLISHAASLGFLMWVKTHGGGLSVERAVHLAANRVVRLDVSIYSLDEAVHDEITRVPGSLRATLAGIRNARAAGLGVKVSTCVFRANLEQIEEIDSHFRAMGCDVNFTTLILLDHSATAELDRLWLAPDELVEAHRRMYALRIKHHGALETGSFEPDKQPCGAARTSLHVTPDGAVWPCVNFAISLGNLREAPLSEIWRTSKRRAEISSFVNSDREKCGSCAGSASCFYCMGQAYARTGDYKQAPPTFHIHTRAKLEARQEMGLQHFTAAQWRTIPMPDIAAPAVRTERKFVFPIHKPQRGGGKRVHQLQSSSGCEGGSC